MLSLCERLAKLIDNIVGVNKQVNIIGYIINLTRYPK